jgi:uncharacterized protein DUF5666
MVTIMKWMISYKRIGLVILMVTGMAATAGFGTAGAAFALDQLNTFDDQEVETPEAVETDEPDVEEGEVEGVVEAVSGNTITIDGVTYTVPGEFVDLLATLPVGATVKIEFFVDSSGVLTITEFDVEDDAEAVENDDDQGDNNDDQGEDEDVDEVDDEGDQGENEDDQGQNEDDQGEDDNSGSDSSGDGI